MRHSSLHTLHGAGPDTNSLRDPEDTLTRLQASAYSRFDPQGDLGRSLGPLKPRLNPALDHCCGSPSCGQGSYFPPFLEPRKTSEKAWSR